MLRLSYFKYAKYLSNRQRFITDGQFIVQEADMQSPKGVAIFVQALRHQILVFGQSSHSSHREGLQTRR